MTSNNVPAHPLRLTETEAGVLGLYDRVLELQLELALLRSHHSSGGVSQAAVHETAESQIRLLESKATLSLINNIVESVVAVQPTLNAVHHATHASPIERDLLPYTEQRDLAVARAARTCSDLRAARDRLAELQVEGLRTSHRNIELASEVLQLAGKTNEHQSKTVEAGQHTSEIAALEGQVKASRHRWRVVKGAASAIVTGSGVDWVTDERLRDMVLDLPD
ncbi:hypothetical protein VTK56DRAFT_8683 [Thermocarpiscus australiensis]